MPCCSVRKQRIQQERGTHDAMSGDCTVAADNLNYLLLISCRVGLCAEGRDESLGVSVVVLSVR